MQQLYNYRKAVTIGTNIKVDENGWITCEYDNSSGTSTHYENYITNNLKLNVGQNYAVVVEVQEVQGIGTLYLTNRTSSSKRGQFSNISFNFENLTSNSVHVNIKPAQEETQNKGLGTNIAFTAGESGKIKFRISVLDDTTITPDNYIYIPYLTTKGNVLGQTGGGSKINGIIEEYKVASGGNINAGDFVAFVNNEISMPTLRNTTSIYYAEHIEEDKVLLAGSGSSGMTAVILKINNNNISILSETIIDSTVRSYPKFILMNNRKLLMTFFLSSELYGKTFKISENYEVTLIKQFSIRSSVNTSTDSVKLLKLNDTKTIVELVYSGDLYIVTLDSINDKKLMETRIARQSALRKFDLERVDNNTLATAYNWESSPYIYTEIYLYNIAEDGSAVYKTSHTINDSGSANNYSNLNICLYKENSLFICTNSRASTSAILGYKYELINQQWILTLLGPVFKTDYYLQKIKSNIANTVNFLTCDTTENAVSKININITNLAFRAITETLKCSIKYNSVFNINKYQYVFKNINTLCELNSSVAEINNENIYSGIVGVAKQKGIAGQSIKVAIPN